MSAEGASGADLRAATVVVLWSQLTAFLTCLETTSVEKPPPLQSQPTPKRQRAIVIPTADDAPKEAITSYREEVEFPASEEGSSRFSLAAVHARVCQNLPNHIAPEDELIHTSWQGDSPERTIYSVFKKLEQLTLERSTAETNDDTNSLREQDDASVMSSFYRTPIVSLLCHTLLDGNEKHRQPDEDQISTEGEDVAFEESVSPPKLMAEIYNSSLFNFCLDRLVEARNRYHARAVMRSAAPPVKVKPEIQSVYSSSYDDADSYVKKCEKLQERLVIQKRARECELREQARARRNLRVQVSSQLHLFRELADLATSPIQVVDPPSTEPESSETDDGYEEQRLRPQLAVPSVPAELSAILRDERVYSLQVKRAVESIVALKANQLDLVVANFTLEEIVRRHLKHSPSRPLPRPHHFSHVSNRSAYFPAWERPPSRFGRVVRPFDLMSSSSSLIHPPPPPHRHVHVSPILRPLQSSPHLSSSELGDFPELRRPFVSSRLMDDSPPLPPCRCPMPRWCPDRRRREFDPVMECPESHPDESNTSGSPPGYFVHSREPTGSFGLSARPPIKSKSFVDSVLYPSLSAAPGDDLTPSQTLNPTGDDTGKAASFKVSTPSKRGLKSVLGGWQSVVKKTMTQLTRGSSNVSKQVKSNKPPSNEGPNVNPAALSRGQLIPSHQQPVLEHVRGRTLQLCSALGGSASFVEQRRSISCGKRSATHNTTADGGESTSSLAGYA